MNGANALQRVNLCKWYSVVLLCRRRIDQALIETSAVVQTPAVNDDKQGYDSALLPLMHM